MPQTEVPQSVLDRYKKVATPTVLGVLRRHGFDRVFLEEVYPMTPGKRLAARARTLRFLPARPDLAKEVSRGEDSPEYRAMALCGPGDVLVVDGLGVPYMSIGGDVKFLQLKLNRADGIVTDAGIRDKDICAGEYGLAIYARRRTPAVGVPWGVPYQANADVQCAGILVRPGDVMVGDDDGVVVVPKALAADIIGEVEEHEQIEAFVKELIEKEGCAPGRYYPVNDLSRRLFEESRKQGKR